MEHFTWFFKFLTAMFTIGWIGCLMTIPLAAYKFFAVLFEEDPNEETQRNASPAPAKS